MQCLGRRDRRRGSDRVRDGDGHGRRRPDVARRAEGRATEQEAEARQLAASLQLTLWLAQRYGIGLNDVIGHAESLTSPYHRERYAPWRCQTHADWQHADMQVYRAKLAALVEAGVP